MSDSVYGRKLKLTVTTASATAGAETITIEQDGFTPEPLRVTFEVDYPGWNSGNGFYYSEIAIYNLNTPTQMQLVDEGATVVLEAGYQNGDFGEIFSGTIFQSLFEREGVTDTKLTLRCLDGARLLTDNFCSGEMAAHLSQQTHFQVAMNAAQHTIDYDPSGINKLRTMKYPRAGVIHATPGEILREIMKYKDTQSQEGNNVFFFTKKGKVLFGELTADPDPNFIVVSPGSGGLVGTPVQTMYGANFVCLLNPKIELVIPMKMVRLDMSLVKEQKASIGELTGILDETQEYAVMGVRHVGDTRGDSWYTYVTGVNRGGAIPFGLKVKQMIGK